MTFRQIVVALVLVSLLLSAGCSSLTGNGADNAPTETTAATETTASTAQPTAGGATSTEASTPAPTTTPTSAPTATSTSASTATAMQTTAGAEMRTTVADSSIPLTNTPAGTNNDQYYLRILETALSQSDFDVVSLEMRGNTVTLSYVTTATTQSGIGYEVGFVAGVYAELVRQGWNVERLDVTAVTATGEPISTWYVESSWARQYNTGEISSGEFVRLIFGTIETSSSGTGTPTGTDTTV